MSTNAPVLSDETDADDSGTVTMDLSPAQVRSAYDPFADHGSWRGFVNKLTQGYLAHERDDWRPIADFHIDILGHFDSDRDFCLLAHRNSLKTTLTLAYVIACLEYQDGYRALWITNTQAQAYKKADAEFWKLVHRNPWLLTLNGGMERDTMEAKEWDSGSMLYAGWLRGSIEGDRAHLMILDDVIKEHGDGETERVLEWVEGVAVPIVKDGGKTVIVGTRKRPDDIYSHIRSREGYDFVEYPAILDVWDSEFREDYDWRDRRPDPSLYTEVENPLGDGRDTIRVLWPDARGPSYLLNKYQKQSPHLFYREYCLVLRGSSGNLIDASDVNQLTTNGGCSIRNQAPPQSKFAGEGERIFVTHDPAQSKTGDLAAFGVWLFSRDGRRTLLDAHAETGMAPSRIKAQLLDYDRRFDPAVIALESNGMQQYLVNDAIELSSTMRAKVKGYPTTGQKHSWENGIPQLRNLVDSGSIHFYRGHGPTEDFIQAIESLELQDGKLKGHTPDYVITWHLAEKANRELEYAEEQNDGSTGVYRLG